MTHEHDFDPVSGYCAWCGYRDDGRLIDLKTAVEYQPARWAPPTRPEETPA